MKRTAEKLALQLTNETLAALNDIRRATIDAPGLDVANLHLRDAIASIRQVRAALERRPAQKAG